MISFTEFSRCHTVQKLQHLSVGWGRGGGGGGYFFFWGGGLPTPGSASVMYMLYDGDTQANHTIHYIVETPYILYISPLVCIIRKEYETLTNNYIYAIETV